MTQHLHVLEGGGRVLLVMGEAEESSFRDWSEDPRVLIWTTGNSTKPRQLHGTVVPSNVRYIMSSHNISHNSAKWLREEARRLRAVYEENTSHGTMKTKLAAFGIKSAPEQRAEKKAAIEAAERKAEVTLAINETSTAEAPTKQAYRSRGLTIEFVSTNHIPSNPPKIEADRLMALAKSQGMDLNWFTIKNTISRLRLKAKNEEIDKKIQRTIDDNRAQRAVAVPPTTTAPAVNQVVKVLDDAITSLQLIRQELLDIERDRHDLAELRKTLAALAGAK